MKGKLQYLYSISVFIGVLLSSYMMMSRDGASRLPLQIFQGSAAPSEASVVDPGVDNLFEFEEAFSNQFQEEDPINDRSPTESKKPQTPTNIAE